MPANDQKVIQIIFEEMSTVEERCEGYREALTEAVADIITAERQHRVKGTNIQQLVNDKCNALGRFLAQNRPPASGIEGDCN